MNLKSGGVFLNGNKLHQLYTYLCADQIQYARIKEMPTCILSNMYTLGFESLSPQIADLHEWDTSFVGMTYALQIANFSTLTITST